MALTKNAPDTTTGNSKEFLHKQAEQVLTRIRVFWPNKLPGTYDGLQLNGISQEFKATAIEVNDPIYHQLVFCTESGDRVQVVGLAYLIIEKLTPAGGIDAEL